MKTLKNFLSVFLIFTLLFLVLSILTFNYFYSGVSSSSGGDGLGGFIELVFFAGAFLICLIGSISISSILFLPKASNIIRFIVATLLSVLTVYFVLAYTFLPHIRFW
ncbi:hypothetical protein ATO12_10350 [Aquimarina atlantica]|uniref:Uncharacterized protein n=1 Tax=Aquimarina atlantica TaxID=1317122 RepID=A0A023BYH8_9FLAO|nr:hypothetical protein [Aquimarina atlantica]EZH75116.1 hypothetical protein ATO12_10350 [Aquimarina atlantica]